MGDVSHHSTYLRKADPLTQCCPIRSRMTTECPTQTPQLSLPAPILALWTRRYRGIIDRSLAHLPTHLLELQEQGVADHWRVTGREMVDRSEWLIWCPLLEVTPVVLNSLPRYGIDAQHVLEEYARWDRLDLPTRPELQRWAESVLAERQR